MFRKPRERFSETLRTQDGHMFRAEFGDPNSAPRPRREIQNLPHRSLSTTATAVVRAGDLVSWGRVKYILAAQHSLQGTERFLAVEVNSEVVWTRVSKVMDPVARVEREGVKQTLDPALPVVLDPTRGIDEEDFDRTLYRIFTHADVQEGDRLDEMKVLRHYDLLGMRVVEVS